MSAVLEFPTLPYDADLQPAPRTDVATVASQALDITAINLTGLALAKFGDWRATTKTAKDELASLVLDLTTQSAIDDAISLRNRKIKQPLADARKVAEGLKSKLSAVSKAVGAELPLIEAAWGEVAGAITPRIEAAQKVIDDAKAAAAAKEAARKAGHEASIAQVRTYLTRCQEPGMTAARIANGIAMLENVAFGAEFEEYAEPAAAVQRECLYAMRALHAQAVSREQEAARQEAIRLENERVAAELAAERARIEAQAAEIRRQQAELAAQRAESERLERVAVENRERIAREEAAAQERHIQDQQAVPAFPLVATPEGDRGPAEPIRPDDPDAAPAPTLEEMGGEAPDVQDAIGLDEVNPPTVAAPLTPAQILAALAAEARASRFPSQPKMGAEWWGKFYAAVDGMGATA